TGFAVAGCGLDRALLPELIAGGQIPLVLYGTPGTPELSAAIEPFIPHYDALLLANHGAVTSGRDLLSAFFRMETIDHCARITLAAETASAPIMMSRGQVAKSTAARARHFVSTPPNAGGGLPTPAQRRESR